jgi:hypothetical protein
VYESKDDIKDERLKQWLELYLANGFNATAAARALEYKDPQQSGWENKKKLERVIAKELSERCMSPEEALARLSSIARADAADLLSWYEDDFGKLTAWFSLEKARERGLTHLIKELEQTQHKNRDGVIFETTWKVKLHDSQHALETILKAHGKMVQQHEHTGKDGKPLVLAIEVVAPHENTD